jgi:hypothetical protein
VTREHGTRAKYVGDKCRCEACRQANREYQRHTTRRIAPTLVGSARARKHLIELRLAGVGLRTIEEATNVRRSTLSNIRKSRVARIRVETEQAILGVTALQAADSARVTADVTWRNVRRLQDVGWSKAAIGRAIGQTNGALQLGKHRVLARHARVIADLCAEHCPEQRDTPVDLPKRWEGDTSWVVHGACKVIGAPTWLFFPGLGDQATVDAALKVCNTCRVTDQCLTYALRNNSEGIWGGTTGRQRRLMTKGKTA